MARIDPAEKSESSSNAAQLPPQLTADAIKKMTEKLSEMMGEDISKDFNQLKNEKGELVNEEGLPIIDITEPVTEETSSSTGPAYFHDGDDYLPNLSTLPSHVRDRLREERNRLFDQLEAEEQMEAAHEDEAEKERKRAILEKRKKEAEDEQEKLKAARELQKKMGRALLKNFALEKAEVQKQEAERLKVDEEIRRTRKISTGPAKHVSFAEIPAEKEDRVASMPKSPPPEPSSSQSWPKGDVAFARLRPKASTPTSFPPSKDNQPMRMTVVERFPSVPQSPAPIRPAQPTIVTANGDSDDESESGEYEPDVEDDDNAVETGSVPTDSDSEGHMSLDEEETDLDFAQHQREVALEYYQKRNKIGKDALEAMQNHTHEHDGELPSDVHLPDQDKPQLSRFKASRLASAYGASASSPQASTSLGASIIPASAANTIQTAIRTGKLDDEDRLVGGDDDSADEYENEGLQEVLQLLKKGQLYTAGPDGEEFHAVPPPKSSAGAADPSAAATPGLPGKAGPFQDLTPIDRPKASKFKLSRASAGRSSGPASSDPLQPVSAPPSVSSSAMISAVLERPASSASAAKVTPPSTMNLMVTERTLPASSASAPRLPVKFPSNIVESPSFPPPAGSIDPFAMIVDSPSFPNPAGATSETPRAAARADTSRPTRPPTVMSSTVKEVAKGTKAQQEDLPKPRKVSRFMAERG